MKTHNTTIKKLVYSMQETEHAKKLIEIYKAWDYKTIQKQAPTYTTKGYCMMIKNDIENHD
jgi:hypothetical protein